MIFQINLLMSIDALYKFVERRQLPVALGGSCQYHHSDWLQDHQAGYHCHDNHVIVPYNNQISKHSWSMSVCELSLLVTGHRTASVSSVLLTVMGVNISLFLTWVYTVKFRVLMTLLWIV